MVFSSPCQPLPSGKPAERDRDENGTMERHGPQPFLHGTTITIYTQLSDIITIKNLLLPTSHIDMYNELLKSNHPFGL